MPMLTNPEDRLLTRAARQGHLYRAAAVAVLAAALLLASCGGEAPHKSEAASAAPVAVQATAGRTPPVGGPIMKPAAPFAPAPPPLSPPK